jgi:hypothetical protein
VAIQTEVFALRWDARLNGDIYLVAGDRVLGPLGDALFPDTGSEERGWPEAFDLRAILQSGGRWQAGLATHDSIVAWYTHVLEAGQERFVERTAGYRTALRSFLASERGAAMVLVNHLEKPWAFPFVRLEPDGQWTAGEDALTQPLVLPIWGLWSPDQDPIPGLYEVMDRPFFLRLRWDRVSRSHGIEFIEPFEPRAKEYASNRALSGNSLNTLAAARILPSFDRARTLPVDEDEDGPLDASSVFSMADDVAGNTYIVADTRALGPLPKEILHDQRNDDWDAIPLRQLEQHGLRWQPRPGNLRFPDAWYVLRESPRGTAFVGRSVGYVYGLRSFVRSETGRAMLTYREHATREPRWAIPFLRLYPNGAWTTGQDVLTQPVVLAACAPMLGLDIEQEMAEDLHRALYDLQWYPDMTPEY